MINIRAEGASFGFDEDLSQNILKALDAGSGAGFGSVGGRSFIPESLEGTMISAVHNTNDAPLMKKLVKETIPSPVHQWSVLDSLGNTAGSFVGERGEAKGDVDASYIRPSVTASYIQVRKTVSLPMKISNAIVDPVARETTNGVLEILKLMEEKTFKGNSDLNPFEYDGARKTIPSQNVFDLRGKFADTVDLQDTMDDLTTTIREQFGYSTDSYWSTAAYSDFQRAIRDRTRWDADRDGGAGGDRRVRSAVIAKTMPTAHGDVEMISDIFNAPKSSPLASPLTADRPGIPTIGLAVASDVLSKFDAADAGTYFYQAVAVNQFGQGVASVASSIAIAAGERVDITVTPDGGGPELTGIIIFRGNKGGLITDPIKQTLEFKYTATFAAAQVVIDFNNELPGTSDIYVFDFSDGHDAFRWASYLPTMKFNLAPVNRAEEPFLVLNYGAPMFKIPKWHGFIKNVQTRSNSAFTFSGV